MKEFVRQCTMARLEPSDCPDEYHLDQSLMGRFSNLLKEGWASGAAIINLIGSYAIGKLRIAETLCREAGLNLLVVDLEQLITDKETFSEKELRLITREALLQRAAIYWKDFDTLLDHQHKALLDTFIRHLQLFPGLTFLAGATAWQPPSELANHTLPASPVTQVNVCRPHKNMVGITR